MSDNPELMGYVYEGNKDGLERKYWWHAIFIALIIQKSH